MATMSILQYEEQRDADIALSIRKNNAFNRQFTARKMHKDDLEAILPSHTVTITMGNYYTAVIGGAGYTLDIPSFSDAQAFWAIGNGERREVPFHVLLGVTKDDLVILDIIGSADIIVNDIY